MDARLLAHVAEAGRIAVHEIAAALGMDPREVAARLVALSATGLPLLVGVECDQKALRAELNSGRWAVARPPSGAHPVHGPPSGRYPAQPPHGGPRGTPSGGHPMPPPPGPPSGPYPAQRPPSGGHPVQAPPSGRNPVAAPPAPAAPAPGTGPAAGQNTGQDPGQDPGYDAFGTWGPPQTSSWARGDQPPQPPPRQSHRPAGRQQGVVGDTLRGEGPDGEQVDIRVVEVVDPADFLFGAAGYRLAPGERSVVVHTELTNASPAPYQTLPDLHLVLVTAEGATIGKAPVALSSRPPHRIGVPPGQTAGGHAVYVLPERASVTAVRWSAGADAAGALTWSVKGP